MVAEAVGLEVACPRCGVAFVARPDAAEPPLVRPSDPPVVRPRPNRPTPLVWELPDAPAPDVERTPPSGGLIALALLPFGIPLLWLLASAVAAREVVWSFAVPVAIAVGASGLGSGSGPSFWLKFWTNRSRPSGFWSGSISTTTLDRMSSTTGFPREASRW